jgi:hypothetical protein
MTSGELTESTPVEPKLRDGDFIAARVIIQQAGVELRLVPNRWNQNFLLATGASESTKIPK